jgi:maleylpyruvate isomerase
MFRRQDLYDHVDSVNREFLLMLKLHGYWRSSAAYRLRIALNLKGLAYEHVSVNIAPVASEQKNPEFTAINPQQRVPVLETEDGMMVQSMAVLEWLEERYPETPILPGGLAERQQARALGDLIACDVHPLNNLSVLTVLRETFGADKQAISRWYADWILRGFAAFEEMIADRADGAFLFGAQPSIAEICLVPQVYNARRFDVDLSAFPKLVALDAACLVLDAFDKAAPHNQPDAVQA